jgi:tetrapyrrole methylase family protein/MazG family protein
VTERAVTGAPGPRIDVVGLGPAGPELVTADTLATIGRAELVFLRTVRHPAAAAFPDAETFDHHYEAADSFDQVYEAIVLDLVAAAGGGDTGGGKRVAYAVPGSPSVAERTVALLRIHPAVLAGEIDLVVHPAVSFLDLAFERLGVDPVTSGVKVVDGESFALDAAGERGPLLVAQCWSRAVLSAIKLSVESTGSETVTVLHHLGLPDEQVRELPWEDLDRCVEPDHLTSLWIPSLAAPVAEELVRLDELVHTLRRECPWDAAQTHGSLARHLLEESYEVLEAIDAVAAVDATAVATDDSVVVGTDDQLEEQAVADLEEELGDLLFQVYFHALLGAEAGRFTLADVARGVTDKLVSRHPHVFGGDVAPTAEAVATNWEVQKKYEKNRSSVTEGIPLALPALSLAAKLQRKAVAVGMVLPSAADQIGQLAEGVATLGAASEVDGTNLADTIGELLFALVNLARLLGIEAETALRTRAAMFRTSVEAQG